MQSPNEFGFVEDCILLPPVVCPTFRHNVVALKCSPRTFRTKGKGLGHWTLNFIDRSEARPGRPRSSSEASFPNLKRSPPLETPSRTWHICDQLIDKKNSMVFCDGGAMLGGADCAWGDHLRFHVTVARGGESRKSLMGVCASVGFECYDRLL
ncbi:hypothetical protein BS17DRAFT_556229 [Gyrodon lividus]|nr:hypothetical protein BS17DRAFT_556229 [Gyrodon lividus]